MGYAKRYPDRVEAAQVLAEATLGVTDERRVAGRVLARRDLGRVVFFDLVDRSDRLQLVCEQESCEPWPVNVSLGDIVGASGKPMLSRRGEPSLAVRRLELLAPTRRPLPDTFHGVVDIELRYRKRYLDLFMHGDVRDVFIKRARIVTAIRRHLDQDGFIEVETPVLQPRYGGAFARPFTTHHNALNQDFYLRIATELYLKRLIVGGLERVYELGKDFRNEGISTKHNPEFTMLEWYEAYADYRDTMRRVEDLVAAVADEVGTTSYKGKPLDFTPPWQRLRYPDALAEQGLWLHDHRELRHELEARGIDTTQDGDWAQLIDHAFSQFVEPTLWAPTIIFDYPIELSPFARQLDDEPSLVERFEYFIGGMELGNAFSEINDALEQQERFDQQATLAEGEPADPDYIEALSYGMPPTGGLGLGVDRLTMILTDQPSIRDVVLFPALRRPPSNSSNAGDVTSEQPIRT